MHRLSSALIIWGAIAALTSLSGCSDVDHPNQTHSETARQALMQASPRSAREAEIAEYVAALRGKRELVSITTMPNGDVIDWLRPEDGVDYSKTPPPPAAIQVSRGSAAEGDALPTLEEPRSITSTIEDNPHLRGPEGTIPLVRPTFEQYVDGSSGKANLHEYIRAIPKGVPVPGSERLWAGRLVNQSIKGVQAHINAAWTAVDIPASDQFSIYQMAVVDKGTSLSNDDEWAGLAVGRIPAILSSNNFRLYLEFFTAGTSNTGNFAGGWAPGVLGYVTQPGTAFPPGVTFSQFSTIGGTQFEGQFVIMFSTVCPISSSCSAAWWVWIRDQWAGYFPIGNGTNMINFNLINSTAAQAAYYGEVFDDNPGVWTGADMTSGRMPNASGSSLGISGYAKNMLYLNSASTLWVIPPESDFLVADGEDTNCYRQVLNSWASPWNRTMWFGGPGLTTSGTGSNCDPF